MAWTQTDIETVRSAISTGARSVTFSDGRRVEYHSLSEMLELLRVMTASVLLNTEGVPPSRLLFAKFTRE